MKKSIIMAVSASLLLFMSGCGGEDPQQAAAQVSEEVKLKFVDVVSIEKQKEPLLISIMGTVEPNQSASLAFNSTGKIVSLPVKKGTHVKRGQVLGELDTNLSATDALTAQRMAEQANASRNQLLQGATKEAIDQQQVKIESARQKLEKAEKDLQTMESLFSNGAISKNEVDVLKNEVALLANNLKTEEISLASLMKGPNQEELTSANLSIAQAQKEMARVNQELQDKVLKAPFNGIVVEVNQQEGDLASGGTPVLTLVDLSQIKVNLQVKLDHLEHFKLYKQVIVRNEDQMKWTGTVSYVSPVADPTSGKYLVEITVPLKNMAWDGGTVVTVQTPRSLSTGIVVPLASVGINESGNYVLVVDDGAVKKQQVELGQTLDDLVEITSGLKEGKKLITSGISYLLEGEKVEIRGGK
ncbi:efflux RND transporter periplasmic adaptor subunit [Ammoniphilus resinae]|uniref:Multidrug efflux pump subunit AcrA (Membrane-fusion protein) n=1 Tax=Ammoniphilus resinae TaxID=861532 RepID=A0ABS4GRU6_9BACL|nr:efflux RND transporter periplasmic adaptor subunit [Ammoniphilus resinae]MBP1932998.1 multidrug efflux pump subunit AcrA (membrane-fusion protein) [Ammoniphilus resinae]